MGLDTTCREIALPLSLLGEISRANGSLGGGGGGGELADGLGALGDSVLGELVGEDEAATMASSLGVDKT